MPIYFDGRWNGPYGIGRFASELQARLDGLRPLEDVGTLRFPVDPLVLSWALRGARSGCFLSPGFNAPWRSPIPVAFTLHDLIDVHLPEASSPQRRAYFRWVVRPAVRRASRVLTVSEFSRRQIVEWAGIPPERVAVVGNGVSAAFRADAGSVGEGRHFLHVGRRVGYKNIERLVRAYARSRARQSYPLVFTGDADAATSALARAAGVQDRVRFTGPLSDEGLAACYRSAVALVFPSLYEGFGIPIVEAMACGTPVITASTGATAEVAGTGNAVLVDPLDSDALSAAMDQLAGDASLREQLRGRGCRRARDHDWHAVATRVATALADVAGPDVRARQP